MGTNPSVQTLGEGGGESHKDKLFGGKSCDSFLPGLINGTVVLRRF